MPAGYEDLLWKYEILESDNAKLRKEWKSWEAIVERLNNKITSRENELAEAKRGNKVRGRLIERYKKKLYEARIDNHLLYEKLDKLNKEKELAKAMETLEGKN